MTTIAESLTLHRCVGNLWAIARSLSLPAGRRSDRGSPRGRLGATLPSVLRSSHDSTVAAVRAALGEEVFEAVWASGQEMSTETAVAWALTDAAPA